MRGLLSLAGCLWLAGWLVAAAPAQEAEPGVAPEVERAIREGNAETLEARFRGTRQPSELHWIAQAYVNRARQATDATQREQALDEAEKRYRLWIDVLGRAVRGDAPAKAEVALAGARAEFAGLLMGQRAAGELDQFEISGGQRGDREKLRKYFGAAREQYGEAAEVVNRLYEQIHEREDEFLAAGIYSTIAQLKLDIAFNQGWATYYMGMLEDKDDRKRTEALREAERRFQEVLDSGQTGQMLNQCYLGVAMAQREQKRYDDADRNFARAMQAGVDPVVEAQVRCELARSHIAGGRKFAEARAVLQPLLEKDARKLPAEERTARFYINLAALLDASSYLTEAEVIRAQAAGSTARTAILRQAERARETGLSKLNRLAAKGGPWPGVVQLYIAANVNLATDPAELSPTELLYTARQLAEAQRFKDAVARLKLAVARPEFQKAPSERAAEDNALGGQLLMELGKTYYRLGDKPQAAATFDKLAREYRSHESAQQAATFAYQLWAEIAKKTKQREDYAHLADTLLNLIQSFPDHPDRVEAVWLLPVALQAGGRYAEAAAEFAKVPEASKHRDEAQFRVVLCRRLALEADRTGKSASGYLAEATKAAAELTDYADATARRASELTKTEAKDLLKWSGEARVSAAELLAAQGVEQYQAAVQAVADFESRYPDSDLVGRVLAVRIRAYRGLRQFEKATEILEQYLQTVSPEQAGAVLSSLARGMQDEVERLLADKQEDAARKLAGESVETFSQLEQWLRTDPKRVAQAAVVAFGRAEMLYTAGQLDPAREAVAGLLEKDAHNGNYQRLLGLVLVAQLSDASAKEQVQAAQEAWAELLKDQTLRKRAPERYWEARYQWLALALRLGQSADVVKAIKQDAVWYPDLGGSPWKEKLEALYTQAGGTESLEAASQPATP